MRHLLQWSASTLEYDENERGRPLSEVTDRVIASRLEVSLQAKWTSRLLFLYLLTLTLQTQLAIQYAATQDRIFNMVVWKTLGQGGLKSDSCISWHSWLPRFMQSKRFKRTHCRNLTLSRFRRLKSLRKPASANS